MRFDISRMKNVMIVLRSYQDERTASHQNCEVKHRWAGSVLLLGTKWESPVLKGNTFAFCFPTSYRPAWLIFFTPFKTLFSLFIKRCKSFGTNKKTTSGEADLNHRPMDSCVVRTLQSTALPLSYPRQQEVGGLKVKAAKKSSVVYYTDRAKLPRVCLGEKI